MGIEGAEIRRAERWKLSKNEEQTDRSWGQHVDGRFRLNSTSVTWVAQSHPVFFIFTKHITVKATKARVTKDALFSRVENECGSVPPHEGRRIYFGRIDPYLIAGCEVALDVNERTASELQVVSNAFLRHILGVHENSTVAFLYSEMGITPLPYRRLLLALSYLRYLLFLPGRHYASLALRASLLLTRNGAPSWFGDLLHVLQRLAPHASFSWRDDLTVDDVLELIDVVEVAAERSLANVIDSSPKGRLLRGFYNDIPIPRTLVKFMAKSPKPAAYKTYLNLPIPTHRKAFTRLLMSAHTLGIEVLRRKERYRPFVPRRWRLCRFCRVMVEDEPHALLECRANDGLFRRRRRFIQDITAVIPEITDLWSSPCSLIEQLWFLLRVANIEGLLAKFIHDVLAIYNDVPVYVAPLALWADSPAIQE
ncbi:uncharacterized protein ARMOST_05755 [Armillaria ostoyae]|uniref:Reverse transcriptase zinc-binding domain-containing protein n=1 Tax=Armillaria ostoyae TaxID=47428 RepID=A0A284R129_ARMOS|nr:uncharacterized protein ARMOST_05755 [Armillaria ostoyae]